MPKRILIVDDEPGVLEMLKIKLEAHGYITNGAVDGLEALTSVQENPPDLIILDLMLPKIDGFRVCTLLKRDPKFLAIPIIILTARSGTTDESQAKECGADLYINKPVNLDFLLAKIKEFLR